ncbi:hypothetical protein K432DRAFT_470169 [Lepidopterella palustris CBS 459.81]|uniref:Wax synthase domain-containing protein n=1 Tax=Lepidopterella palustris CBS 459.81 TaxID=1314670 RepID=A0A8E2EFG1_9PEZI|nr:hypothetical protein K432DRAFT_470169 [Lepidopterella palustris CBS 459.81]
MVAHPVLWLVAEIAISTFVVGFTLPSSFIRPASLSLMVLCLWQCLPKCVEYMIRSPWAALLGGYAVSFFFHYLDIALLSRWSFESGGPTSGLAKSSASPEGFRKMQSGWSVASRLQFGASLTFSFRFIGTPYEVKNVPRFSSHDAAYVPSRSKFLIRTLITVIVSYLFLDVVSYSADPEVTKKFFSMANIPIFTRTEKISAEELFMRFFATLISGIAMNAVQRGVYSTAALFCVGLGINGVKDWPPFYGSYLKIYSMRNLWGIFWHQTNARKLSSISHFLVHDVLHLPRGCMFSRYFRAFVTLLTSGVMHLLIDIAAGIPIQRSGAIRFFCTQFFSIVLEDIAISIYRSLFMKGEAKQRAASAKEKAVGAAWVALFLTWSTPVYLYPMMWRGALGLEDSTVPWSVAGFLVKGKA